MSLGCYRVLKITESKNNVNKTNSACINNKKVRKQQKRHARFLSQVSLDMGLTHIFACLPSFPRRAKTKEQRVMESGNIA